MTRSLQARPLYELVISETQLWFSSIWFFVFSLSVESFFRSDPAAWKLYGDYFRHAAPDAKTQRDKWVCPGLEQCVALVGTPNAYNTTSWVETDAVNSM